VNGLRLAQLLKPVVVPGTLVSCVLSFLTSAFATSIVGYSANADMAIFLAPERLILGPGTTFTLGNASASIFVDPSFIGARAVADDLVVGTSASKASLGFASVVGALTGPIQIDVPFAFTWVTGAAIVPLTFPPLGESATAHTATRLSIQVDGVEVASDVRSLTLSQPGSIFNDPPTTFDTLSLSLGPGLHPILISAQADGFLDLSPSPVPEPTTLLLVGTTAAGLGLARWRQRRRKQREPVAGA
jgi:PEP-CTERM motif-containing protein